MKNAVTIIFTACLILIAASFLVSCANNPADTISGTMFDSSSSSGSSGTGTEQPKSPSSQKSTPDSYDIEKYATMEEYIKSDSVREEVEALNKTLKEYGMELTVSADGNKFIYTYRMTQDIDTSKMVESLEKLLDEQTDSFTVLANALKYKVETDGTPVFVIRYVDINANEFCIREYPAE